MKLHTDTRFTQATDPSRSSSRQSRALLRVRGAFARRSVRALRAGGAPEVVATLRLFCFPPSLPASGSLREPSNGHKRERQRQPVRKRTGSSSSLARDSLQFDANWRLSPAYFTLSIAYSYGDYVNSRNPAKAKANAIPYQTAEAKCTSWSCSCCLPF